MNFINDILLYINKSLDFWLPVIILAAILIFDLVMMARWIYREGLPKSLIYFMVLVVAEIVTIIILKIFPEWILWVLLYAAGLLIYFSTKKYGGRRSVYSYLGHLSIFLVGRLLGRWTGIILISFPIMIVYYNTMYHLAKVIVPEASPAVSKPPKNSSTRNKDAFEGMMKHLLRADIPSLLLEIGDEKWLRFLVFLWYTWGIQFPILVVKDSFGRQFETHINGNSSKKWGEPGLICAKSHQAVGITKGIRFSRVDGPGVVFTHPYERIFDIVDLRPQSRSAEIDAMSKDGHPFKAILSSSFAIDRQEWNVADFHRLQNANPILKDGKELDHDLGSYPYSQARVLAALSTTGVSTIVQDSGSSAIHWDNWVLSQVEEAARFVLSQRNLDELWRPKNDSKGTSALSEISAEIMSLTKSGLQECGINLFSARISNLIFPDDDPIILQNITTWRAAWKQLADQTISEGKAEAERLQQEAKAYARSILLTSLAEGMQTSRASRPNLARNIIALRFIGALEDLLQQQPTETIEEQRTRIEEQHARLELLKQQILLNRNIS